MPSLADLVAGLAADPKPVFCLDTCDILEVVQCLGWEKANTARNSACVAAAARLEASLETGAANLVITELVATEWHQNIAAVRVNASQFLTQIDLIAQRVRQAATPIKTALPPMPTLSTSTLVDNLFSLSQALLNRAVRIDLDSVLLTRAVGRVLAKRRPSQDGHLKDSIHLEHYLELARRLRAAGFAEEFLFVSGNKRDFWSGQYAVAHPDLAPEFDDPAARVRFFGSIESAVGHLRL